MKICLFCGQLFTPKDRRQKYCSKSCYWASRKGKFKGKNNPMYGKHFRHTEETKQKIREARLKYYEEHPDFNRGKNHPMYGRNHSEKTKNIISEKLKDNKNHLGCEFSVEEKRKLSARRKEFLKSEKGQEWAESIMGEGNPGWRGGTSFEPYPPEFNNKLKNEVRELWGNVCFVCGRTEEENGQELDVHHTTFDKEQNGLYQLIPLCLSHHGEVHSPKLEAS